MVSYIPLIQSSRLIGTICLSSRDGLNTRALLSILRLEILCSRQDQEAGAIPGSDTVALKVKYINNWVCLCGKGKEGMGGTNLKIRTTARGNFLTWSTTSE